MLQLTLPCLDLPFPQHSINVQTIQINDSPSFRASEKLLNDLALQSGVDDLTNIHHSTVSSYDGPSFRIAQDAEVLIHILQLSPVAQC
jgi:hypothetical protein